MIEFIIEKSVDRFLSKSTTIFYYNKKDRYRKQIAHQHSCFKTLWRRRNSGWTATLTQRTFYRQYRRLSLTVAFLPSMAEDTVKLLSGPGSPSFVTFDSKRRYLIPLAEALNTRGGIFFNDFRLKPPFIAQTVGDRLMVNLLWNINRKS